MGWTPRATEHGCPVVRGLWSEFPSCTIQLEIRNPRTTNLSIEPLGGRAESDTLLVELMARVETQARPMLIRFGLTQEEEEDLLQESFLIFLRKRDEIWNPETWLFGTLRNLCLRLVRRRYQSLVDRVDRNLLEEVAEAKARPEDLRDLQEDFERVLQGLSENCRIALRLRYLEDQKPKEIAHRMDYNSSGIYKMLDRCRSAFLRRLGFLGAGSEELR